MKKEINFIAWVDFQDLALAQIIYPTGTVEYAVVRGADRVLKVWDFSLGYFSDFEEAKAKFMSKLM